MKKCPECRNPSVTGRSVAVSIGGAAEQPAMQWNCTCGLTWIELEPGAATGPSTKMSDIQRRKKPRQSWRPWR